MTHEIELDSELNALLLTTSGVATLAGFESFITVVLADPRWTPGMNLIGDHSRLDFRSFSPGDIEQVAEMHIANDERIGPGFLAIVTGQPATFGLARMWEAYTDGRLAAHTRVFHTVAEARGWLREAAGKSTGQVV